MLSLGVFQPLNDQGVRAAGWSPVGVGRRRPSSPRCKHSSMRYRTIVADSARWDGFAFRPSDIVISTPPKCGTTWTQKLCALLIFDGPDVPGAARRAVAVAGHAQSIDRRGVGGELAAQTHRRFIKTHTPLDGMPLRKNVTYIVVGRDPRDVAVSFEHHRANLDFAHFLELRRRSWGRTAWRNSDPAARRPRSGRAVSRVRSLRRGRRAATLAGVLQHMQTAWQRRRDAERRDGPLRGSDRGSAG